MERKALTHEEIRERLRNMVVGKDGVLPVRFFHFVVRNPDYDPDNFSQEIEGSEKEIDTWDEIKKEMERPGFDFVWNNTLGSIPRNSEEWERNHAKICRTKMLIGEFLSCSVTRVVNLSIGGETVRGTVSDYDGENTMKKILEVEEKYGEIYAIG